MAGEGLEFDVSGLDSVQFGEEIRQKEFCLRPGACFLNHGSYGTVPRRILELQKHYLDSMESHLDDWFRHRAFPLWNESRQTVADFVGSHVEDLVFVINATQGINTVLRSLKFEPGDAILATSLTYGSLKHLWQDMEEHISPGVKALVMEVKMPIVSEDSLVQQYDHFLSQHPNVKFVLIDHITSPSAILMPVKRLIEVCHKYGAMVMVDGAHAPGQVHLNLKELGADFYAGNLHKWLYTPRGCGILWIKGEHQDKIRPLQSTWARGMSLSHQFFEQATRDHIPSICAKQAVQFYQAIGGMDKVVGYTSDLATKARDFLSKELGLARLDIPPSMEAPNLRMLQLPGLPEGKGHMTIKEAGHKLMDEIYKDEDIQLVMDNVDGRLYLRLSLQIYNTMSDIHRVLPVLKKVVATCIPYADK